MLITFFYLLKKNLSNVSDFILKQLDTTSPNTRFHSLFLFFLVIKLLFHKISISFMKDILYNISS